MPGTLIRELILGMGLTHTVPPIPACDPRDALAATFHFSSLLSGPVALVSPVKEMKRELYGAARAHSAPGATVNEARMRDPGGGANHM